MSATQLAFFHGVGERNRILAAMAENHSVYLTSLRSFARVICLEEGSVTIDRLREVMKERGFPFPDEINADNRILGTVFNTKDFIAVGQRPTKRTERIARSGIGSSFVTTYRLSMRGDV